ncbi:MAG: OB-fold domain-containing protein [Proteobacteria bacterium]|nr:OB-fold domain-containing protein [Pseudomonadota bacterium]HQR02826.1 OB-fold domain-containing protein [Rhodocyclaceae bacterium]
MKDEDFFWEGIKEDRLLFQKCSDCGTLRQPPGPMCPSCQSLHWAPHAASGRGKVVTWIVSAHPTRRDAPPPRTVVLVDLEEGVSLISNLQGIDPKDVYEGLEVEVFYQDFNGLKLHQFRPVQKGSV